jgi:hypothetical protein
VLIEQIFAHVAPDGTLAADPPLSPLRALARHGQHQYAAVMAAPARW